MYVLINWILEDIVQISSLSSSSRTFSTFFYICINTWTIYSSVGLEWFSWFGQCKWNWLAMTCSAVSWLHIIDHLHRTASQEAIAKLLMKGIRYNIFIVSFNCSSVHLVRLMNMMLSFCWAVWYLSIHTKICNHRGNKYLQSRNDMTLQSTL